MVTEELRQKKKCIKKTTTGSPIRNVTKFFPFYALTKHSLWFLVLHWQFAARSRGFFCSKRGSEISLSFGWFYLKLESATYNNGNSIAEGRREVGGPQSHGKRRESREAFQFPFHLLPAECAQRRRALATATQGEWKAAQLSKSKCICTSRKTVPSPSVIRRKSSHDRKNWERQHLVSSSQVPRASRVSRLQSAASAGCRRRNRARQIASSML